MQKPKICKVHGLLSEDQYSIEKNGRGTGMARRCKLCRTEKRLNRCNYNCSIHGLLSGEDIYESGGCKKCARNRAKEYKKNNKDLVLEKVRKDKELNPEKWYEIYKREYIKQKNKYGKLLSLKKCCDARGITIEDYQRMLEKQKEVCAICHQAETRLNGRTKEPMRLVIDHCHETNKVRGLLCHSCNTALGKFQEDSVRMYRAIRYIKLGGY